MAPCKEISLWKGCLLRDFLAEEFIAKGFLVETGYLHSDFFMDWALSKGISGWNRLFAEWFLYGKGLFVKGVPYGKGSS